MAKPGQMHRFGVLSKNPHHSVHERTEPCRLANGMPEPPSHATIRVAPCVTPHDIVACMTEVKGVGNLLYLCVSESNNVVSEHIFSPRHASRTDSVCGQAGCFSAK